MTDSSHCRDRLLFPTNCLTYINPHSLLGLPSTHLSTHLRQRITMHFSQSIRPQFVLLQLLLSLLVPICTSWPIESLEITPANTSNHSLISRQCDRESNGGFKCNDNLPTLRQMVTRFQQVGLANWYHSAVFVRTPCVDAL
jgi:hypothetical protein